MEKKKVQHGAKHCWKEKNNEKFRKVTYWDFPEFSLSNVTFSSLSFSHGSEIRAVRRVKYQKGQMKILGIQNAKKLLIKSADFLGGGVGRRGRGGGGGKRRRITLFDMALPPLQLSFTLSVRVKIWRISTEKCAMC